AFVVRDLERVPVLEPGEHVAVLLHVRDRRELLGELVVGALRRRDEPVEHVAVAGMERDEPARQRRAAGVRGAALVQHELERRQRGGGGGAADHAAQEGATRDLHGLSSALSTNRKASLATISTSNSLSL